MFDHGLFADRAVRAAVEELGIALPTGAWNSDIPVRLLRETRMRLALRRRLGAALRRLVSRGGGSSTGAAAR
jgi:hypothetical protein